MHSFLLLAGARSHETAEQTLKRAHRVNDAVMPKLAVGYVWSHWLIPEIGGGIVTVCPSADQQPSILQRCSTPDFHVLVLGRVLGNPLSADAVRLAYERDGVEKVRLLAGSFAAVIIDRQKRKVIACSDVLGRNHPQYLSSGTELLLSPHNMFIAASGRCALDLNFQSALSAAAFDWSLGGAPMLASLNALDPLGWIEWQNGELKTHTKSLWFQMPRMKRLTRRDRVKHAASLLCTLREEACALSLNTTNEIHVGLTAGLDSRAVLALLYASVRRDRLCAMTIGASRSLDVRIAQKLAHIAGLRHQRVDPATITAKDFSHHTRLLAYYSNGDVNAKYALNSLPSWNPKQALLCGGGGGEIYRGYYYPYFWGRPIPDNPNAIASELLRRKAGQFEDLAISSHSALFRGLSARLQSIFEGYYSMGLGGADMLDMFYLMERYGKWGALAFRNSWQNYWAPLASASATRLFQQLPSPLGLNNMIHKDLVYAMLPKSAYRTPVNRWQRLSFEGPGHTRFWLRLAGQAMTKVESKLKTALPKYTTSSLEQIRGDFMRCELTQELSDLLLSSDSVTSQVLGRRGAETLWNNFHQNNRYLHRIGPLVGLEYWCLQLRQVSELIARD